MTLAHWKWYTLYVVQHVSMFPFALFIVSSADSKLNITKPVRSRSYGIVNLVCCELVIFLKLHLWQLTVGILWQAPLTKVYSWARWCRQLESKRHDVTNQAALCKNRQPRDSIHHIFLTTSSCGPKTRPAHGNFPVLPTSQAGSVCFL